jgi:hypothetical protein
MNLTRRTFFGVLPAPLLAARELRCDVAILGAGVGGCAGALAALRTGASVVLTEETDWVGGQLTSQAVPPDEHPWIEAFGSTQSYRTYRNAVRDYYRRNYPMREEIRRRELLNPGGGSVSRLTHEPRVSLEVLESMLAPYISGGQLILLLGHVPVAADVQGDSIRAVTVRNTQGGATRTIHAPFFLDATEQGDLLPLTKTEYVTGFESRAQTGELHAPEKAQPENIQSFTVCFAIDHLKGENQVIDKPEEYSFWRDYVPKMTPPWTGKLLSWSMSDPKTLKERPVTFEPNPQTPPKSGRLNLWLYRQIATPAHYMEGTFRSGISLVNWPQNDYWLGNLHEVSDAESTRHLKRAKQLSLSLLYWMQTEAPREDGGQGFPGLRLRHDQVGTEDGLAKYPYIRESRRIQAEFTVLEQHVGTEARGSTTAENFNDSVGIGSYRIDLHPSSGGDNYIDVSSLPFQIPLGSLIPKRVNNLLAACKNLGVTHITNGCYRLHPVEWNIGESAGAMAAYAVHRKLSPRQVRNDQKMLAEFQKHIQAQGVEIAWPRVTPR